MAYTHRKTTINADLMTFSPSTQPGSTTIPLYSSFRCHLEYRLELTVVYGEPYTRWHNTPYQSSCRRDEISDEKSFMRWLQLYTIRRRMTVEWTSNRSRIVDVTTAFVFMYSATHVIIIIPLLRQNGSTAIHIKYTQKYINTIDEIWNKPIQ